MPLRKPVRKGNSRWTVSFASRNGSNTRNPHCAWMISETPTLSSRTRHTSTKKRSSCYVGAFVMYIPSGADGSANTKQGCNRSCATSTEISGKAVDVAVSPPNLSIGSGESVRKGWIASEYRPSNQNEELCGSPIAYHEHAPVNPSRSCFPLLMSYHCPTGQPVDGQFSGAESAIRDNKNSAAKLAPRPPQLAMRVPFEPTAFPSRPHFYVMYELHL